MAHMNQPNYNYVCIKSAKYIVKNEDNKFTERWFYKGDKVAIKGFYGYFALAQEYQQPSWHLLSEDKVAILDDSQVYYECDSDYYGDYVYFPRDTIRSFRPIIHKHYVTKAFKTDKEMNEWLINIPTESIKDIKINDKIGSKTFLVIYIDKGDDE